MAFWIALHQLKHKGFACLMKHQGPCCSALWHSSEVFTHKALCSLDTTNEGSQSGRQHFADGDNLGKVEGSTKTVSQKTTS